MQARSSRRFNQGSPIFGAEYQMVMKAKVGGRHGVRPWHPFGVHILHS